MGIAVDVRDNLDAEQLIGDLGYNVLATVEHECGGRFSTVRLGAPGRDARVVVDLLFASSGIEFELVAAAPMVDVDGVGPIPVASRVHLIALKLLSERDLVRAQDRADLERDRKLNRLRSATITASDWISTATGVDITPDAQSRCAAVDAVFDRR